MPVTNRKWPRRTAQFSTYKRGRFYTDFPAMKTGRPLKKIDSRQVEKMAGYGSTNVEIADILGVSEATIRGRFCELLVKARSARKMKLRRKQFDMAMQGNVSMLIWLGKNELDQKDKSEHSISDELFEVIVGKRKAENQNPDPGT